MREARARLEVVNRLGIHARAASLLVKLAKCYAAEIVVSKDGQQARATSVMELLMLCAQCGAHIDVHATGEDASDAVAAVGGLVADRFGEPD